MKKIKILIPVYNDWQSVFKLLENIDSEIIDLNINASVLIVNDASTEKRPEINTNLNNIKSVQVINMKENRGHAKCNATGLKYIFEKEEFDYVIPMDGDGEDRPEELKSLIEKTKEYPDMVITADRIKRSEGLLFKFCYDKKLHRQVVVGVNSDRSINGLKGPYRPIMSEEERTVLLLAIQWVDYVVVFDTVSVLPLIKVLKPHVLVKGGNYSTKPCAVNDHIVGQEFVESYSGRVYTAPLVEGISTTEIIKRIMVPIPEKTEW